MSHPIEDLPTQAERDAAWEIVKILRPFSSEERRNLITALKVRMLIGEVDRTIDAIKREGE